MSKIKSISRYITTYNRANVYDDSIVENKYQVSYLEMDERGNIVEDKVFDSEENIENFIKRIFNEDNKLVEESFFDDFDDQAYEIRQFVYDEKGVLSSEKINYMEDSEELHYIYSSEGKLLQKTATYSDGTSYVENEYEWENDNLIKLVENEEDDLVLMKKMTYNEQGQLVELETIEYLSKDSNTEKYEYDGDKLTKQSIFNYKGDLMTTVKNRYEGDLLTEKTMENSVHFFKHLYKYDEQGRKIQESVLNRDDLVLTDYQTEYNDDGLELNTKTYSLNIVDEEKELILIEQQSYEYSFFN